MHECDIRDCGKRWCNDCGERLTCQGPEPAPRCPEHDTCADCATHVVYCTECQRVAIGGAS